MKKTLTKYQSVCVFGSLVAMNVLCYAMCNIFMARPVMFGNTSVGYCIGAVVLTLIGMFMLMSKKPIAYKVIGSVIGLAGVACFILPPALDLPDIGFSLSMYNTADFLLFTPTYILSDVFSESFGYKASRFSNNLTAAITILINLIAKAVLFLPTGGTTPGSEAFSQIFSAGFYSSILGVLIYVVGDFCNDRAFRFLKKVTGGDSHGYSVRSMLSSMAGKIPDVALFSILVFIPFNSDAFCKFFGMENWGMSAMDIISNGIVGFTFQIVIEIIFVPVSFLAARWLKNHLNPETIELIQTGE